MFTRIVVPLDTSLLAECVVPQVRTLADKWGSTVELVHAIESGSPAAELAGERYLADAASVFGSAIHVECTVRPGAPTDVIIEAAGDRRDTLIAMSTHGRTGVERWLLGSVADKVLRASRSPILLLRGSNDIASLVPALLDQITLPLDGSPASEVAFETAVGMAHTLGVPLLLVRCISTSGSIDAEVVSPSIVRAEEQGVEEYLVRKSEEAMNRGAEEVSHRVLWGSPADALIDLAQRNPSSLTVMSTHGRSGVSRWALGSVTDRVVRHTHQPVLVVRAFQDEAKERS